MSGRGYRKSDAAALRRRIGDVVAGTLAMLIIAQSISSDEDLDPSPILLRSLCRELAKELTKLQACAKRAAEISAAHDAADLA